MPEQVRKVAKEAEIIQEVKPLVAITLVIICVISFYEFSSHSQSMYWLKHEAFDPGKLLYWWSKHNWNETLGIANMMFWSSFSQASFGQFVGNIYFLWVFGSTLETRLGNGRLLTLVLASLFLDWVVLTWTLGPAAH